MGNKTEIAWTRATWNPWIGCAKEHTGCKLCYAEASMGTWLRRVKWGPGGTRQLTGDDAWKEVHKLNATASKAGEVLTVFTASLSDIFEAWPGQLQDHKKRPLFMHDGPDLYSATGRPMATHEPGEGLRPCKMDDALRSVLRTAMILPMLRFLMLTKRPYLIRDRLAESAGLCRLPYNCIAGTSISDQATAEFYAGALRDMKEQGIVRTVFLSYEPAVGPVDWRSLRLGEWCDWLIGGGESSDRPGIEPRVCKEIWLDDAQSAAADAGIPFFRKQQGGWSIDRRGRRVIYQDGKGGDVNEWPQRFRVRQQLVNPDGSLLRL